MASMARTILVSKDPDQIRYEYAVLFKWFHINAKLGANRVLALMNMFSHSD